jgi:hypothetical protein
LTIGMTAQANGSMNAAALIRQEVAFLSLDPTKRGVPMPLFDVLGLIPQGLQRQIAGSIVDFVSEQAEKFLGDWKSSAGSSAG